MTPIDLREETDPEVQSPSPTVMVEAGATQNQGNNLHVSGLHRSVDEPRLKEFFSSTLGKPVVKAQIMLDPHSQESRGFGFVMVETSEDALVAIEKLNGQQLEGKTVTIAHARRGRARTPTPGRYHGVKVETAPRSYGGGYDRPYQPRSYDSRYSDRGPPRCDLCPSRGVRILLMPLCGNSDDDRDRRYDDRRDERRYDERRYDDRRSYRDDPRDRRDDYYASRDPAPRDP
uniref:RRM domain-containing protein n=1 Tax=Kwoniella dejecticola CBS 10117 TaxID=1296121 RepID=A0A1A6A3M6_9TREE|nr:uncharacterized protein I303_05513 [Kwoniella dejecticola CBS 10117]OBR84654.1 hypothetical protein I303_05513 [Kwoniella dejecticola CBS 10117]